MSKLTKNQKIAYAKVEPEKAYKLTEAAALLKEITFTKFSKTLIPILRAVPAIIRIAASIVKQFISDILS